MATRLTTKVWTQERLNYLRQIYPVGTWEEIIEAFPFASKNAIKSTANLHDIKRQVSPAPHSNIKHNETLFNSWSEKSAYLLGYLEADGYIKISPSPRQPSIGISIWASIKDKEYIEQLKLLTDFTGKICYRKHNISGKIYETCGFTIHSRNWKDFLLNHLRIGKVPKDIPKEYLHHYIRGYFDGDGSIFTDKQSKSIHSNFVGNPKKYFDSFVLKIEEILGNKKTIYQKTSSKNCWYINLAKKDTQKLVNFMYNQASIFLQRKWEIAKGAK